MKTETRDLLGFNVPVVGIVETLAEAISASGSEDAVVKDYVNNVLAHSHYTILRRDGIVGTLVKLTGIKLKTKKVGEKEIVDEKESEYIARLEDELGETTLKEFSKQVSEACSKITVDYTPGNRGSGSTATPAKKWLAYYDQLVTEEKLDAFCAKNGLDLSDMDEETIKITVANKVKDIVTAKAKAAEKAAMEV